MVRADPCRERGGSLLHLELNLSVIWRKQVVEPNGRRGKHQNCHPANTKRNATDLTDSVCTTKNLGKLNSEDFAFAILGLPYDS